MATLTWPATARITYHSPRLVFPGQVRLQSVYGTGSQVIDRAPGHWQGTVDIAQVSTRRGTGPAVARDIRALIADLQGISNTVNIPIHAPSAGGVAAGTVMTITGTPAITGGRVEVDTNYSHATARLQKGDYVRIGLRLYILASNQRGSGRADASSHGPTGHRRDHRGLGGRHAPRTRPRRDRRMAEDAQLHRALELPVRRGSQLRRFQLWLLS